MNADNYILFTVAGTSYALPSQDVAHVETENPAHHGRGDAQVRGEPFGIARERDVGDLRRDAGRVVVVPRERCERAIQDEPRDAFRIRGGKERRHRTTGSVRDDRHLVGAGGIDHSRDVVHPLLEARELVQPTGPTGRSRACRRGSAG